MALAKKDSEAKAGRKLPPVTVRDDQGRLSIVREELTRQSREFLQAVGDAQFREFKARRQRELELELELNGFLDIADDYERRMDDRGLGDD